MLFDFFPDGQRNVCSAVARRSVPLITVVEAGRGPANPKFGFFHTTRTRGHRITGLSLRRSGRFKGTNTIGKNDLNETLFFFFFFSCKYRKAHFASNYSTHVVTNRRVNVTRVRQYRIRLFPRVLFSTRVWSNF